MMKSSILTIVLVITICPIVWAQNPQRIATAPAPRSVFVDPLSFMVNQDEAEAARNPQDAEQDESQGADGIQATPAPSLRGPVQIRTISAAASNPESASVGNSFAQYTNNAVFSGSVAQGSTQTIAKTWYSPNSYHRPLYFEDDNVERYGNYHPRLQPVISGARFVKDTLTIPYQLAAVHPHDCQYSLGHYRPGNCNPAYRPQFQINKRGAFAQGLLTAGLLIGL